MEDKNHLDCPTTKLSTEPEDEYLVGFEDESQVVLGKFGALGEEPSNASREELSMGRGGTYLDGGRGESPVALMIAFLFHLVSAVDWGYFWSGPLQIDLLAFRTSSHRRCQLL